MSDRPLLFLDIDGTVIPFGRSAPSAPSANPYLARVDPHIGRRLATLRCELVWATTWEDEANREVAPRLGLEALPVVRWPEPTPEGAQEDRWFNLHWKTRTLVAWASGRPFVWIDDEITADDSAWVVDNHPGRALLLPVKASLGVTEGDLDVVEAWVSG
ncbi:HAD domain-containing protein [Glycomyces sp. NPDC046736]|uniref:HAD domain-containing protein n=1 Tax=Glycomyces sp. NPDC046736 TaxID=3155615 RepID=UPI0033C30B97